MLVSPHMSCPPGSTAGADVTLHPLSHDRLQEEHCRNAERWYLLSFLMLFFLDKAFCHSWAPLCLCTQGLLCSNFSALMLLCCPSCTLSSLDAVSQCKLMSWSLLHPFQNGCFHSCLAVSLWLWGMETVNQQELVHYQGTRLRNRKTCPRLLHL